MPESIDNLLKWLAGGIVFILSIFGGRSLLQFVINWRKTSTESAHVSSAANMSTMQLSDTLVREWMKTASDAASELMVAKRQILLAESCLRDGLRIMRAASIAEADDFEQRINAILGVK